MTVHSHGIKLPCHPFAYLHVAKPRHHSRSLQLSEIQKPQATQVGDMPPSAKSVCAFSPEGRPQKGDPPPFSQRQQLRTHVQVCTGTGVSLGTAEGRSLIAGGGCPGFSGPAVRRDATGPPEGGQRGGCPEWGLWCQKRPLQPAHGPLQGGLSQGKAVISTTPPPTPAHRAFSDVKLLPSSFCLFLKINF